MTKVVLADCSTKGSRRVGHDWATWHTQNGARAGTRTDGRGLKRVTTAGRSEHLLLMHKSSVTAFHCGLISQITGNSSDVKRFSFTYEGKESHIIFPSVN